MSNVKASTGQVGQTTVVKQQDEEFFVFYLEQDSILTFDKHIQKEIINEINYINDLFDRKKRALEEYAKAKEDLFVCEYKSIVELIDNFVHHTKNNLLELKRKAYLKVQKEFQDVMGFFQDQEVSDTSASIKMSSAGIKEILIVAKYKEDAHGVVRPGFLEKFKSKFKLSLDGDAEQGGKSFIKDGKIDWKKLQSQVASKKGISLKIKGQVPWFDQWIKKISINKVYSKIESSYNKDLGEYASVSFSSEAQFLRAGVNCGGWTYEIDPLKAKLSTKLDASIDFTIAEGKSCVSFITPRNGQQVDYKDIHFGTFRFVFTLTGDAGIGVAASAGLSLDVDLSSDDSAKITGNPGSPDTLLSGEPGAKVDVSKGRGAETAASASFFIGGSIEGNVAGALEWQCPETDDGKALEFKALATAKLGIAASFGIGAEASFGVDFHNGKFVVYCKAALCWGPGSKGSLGFEVDAAQVIHFIKWTYHQVVNSNYKMDLVVISAAALFGVNYMLLACIGIGLKNFAENLYGPIDTWFTKINKEWGDENTRIELMLRLTDNPDITQYMLPEAKGQILWTLMQSEWWASFMIENSFGELKDIRPGSTPRKRALILVFTWVQSKAEFRSIMTHIKPSLESSTIPWEDGYSMLKYFLDINEFNGIFSIFSSDYDGNLEKFYQQLRETTPLGYPPQRNGMEEYLTHNDISPYFKYVYPEKEDDYVYRLMVANNTHQNKNIV